MKRSPLLPVVALVFLAGCIDSTAPSQHALLNVKQPSVLLKGNTPPPPVDAAIEVSISSGSTAFLSSLSTTTTPFPPFSGLFTGTYFANGANVVSSMAATEIGDESLAFLGTAWLRLDNNQATGTVASANARFQTTDQKFSGHGTLRIFNPAKGDYSIVQIDEVTFFFANPECTTGDVCAIVEFKATVDGDPNYTGRAVGFNRDVCLATNEGFYLTCYEPGVE